MKKILIPLIASCIALLPSCSEDNLEIDQKGVVYTEDFYTTDEECEQAMVNAYEQFLIDVCTQKGGSIYAPFRLCYNLCGDDLFAAGAFLGDNEFAPQMNEFRYDNSNSVISNTYKNLYLAIQPNNLIIDNFKDGLPGAGHTETTKRCVAEAKVLRAYLHMMLAIGWGNVPIIDHCLLSSDLPVQSGSQTEVFEWCIKECKDALNDLRERQSPEDKNGSIIVTKGFANSIIGKCYIFLKDWKNAKEALRTVIDSKKYTLVSSRDWATNFHQEGDLNCEKIFEGNIDENKNADWGAYMNRTTWMEVQMWNWRSDHFVLSPTNKYSGQDGWGGCGVPKAFADEFIKHDGNSIRLKSSIVNIEDVVYDKGEVVGGKIYNALAVESTNPLFKYSDKLSEAFDMQSWSMKPVIGKDGIQCHDIDIASLDQSIKDTLGQIGIKENGLYGQSLYLPLKPIVYGNECTNGNMRLNNFIIMRYAEVLLMYAEACAQLGETSGDGLDALLAVQEHAGLDSEHKAKSLSLDEVKAEKKFEMWLEGCRWADICRWEDFDGVKKAGTQVTSIFDTKTRPIVSGDQVVEKSEDGRFYSIYAPEAQGRATGFQEKHKLFPYPHLETAVNPNIKQNPGW